MRRGLEDLYLIRATVSRQGLALTPSSAQRRLGSGPHPVPNDPNPVSRLCMRGHVLTDLTGDSGSHIGVIFIQPCDKF